MTLERKGRTGNPIQSLGGRLEIWFASGTTFRIPIHILLLLYDVRGASTAVGYVHDVREDDEYV